MNSPVSGTEAHQLSILVVEDEEGPREALKMVLSPYFNLYTVDSAEVALEVLKSQPIDLVTLDLKLPGQQGLELLEQVRREGRDIEVIIITGYGTLQSAIDAIRHGVAAYILKPFNVSDLLGVVNRAIERRTQVSSLQKGFQAFGNLWTQEGDVKTALANIEVLLGAKNPELAQHAGRVNFYACLLAEHLDLSPTDREAVQLGAYLHDVGKIGIQDRLISGQAELSNQDEELLRCHPIIGERMMKALPFPPQVVQIIRHHHEHFDGTGYPDGLQGEDIPLLARLVSLANIFDNLVSGQSGRIPLAVPQAREQIRQESGIRLDPTLTDLFTKVVW